MSPPESPSCANHPPGNIRGNRGRLPGLDVETLIRRLFTAQTTAQVALAMAQNSNLIAFHTATAQVLGSKSGDKDTKLTVAKKAILQACCGQVDSNMFAALRVYLDMEVEGGRWRQLVESSRSALRPYPEAPTGQTST